VELVAIPPDAEVDARPLDGGREPRERSREQPEPTLEAQRPAHVVGGDKGQRDRRRVVFLAPQTRPEGGVEHRFDRARVRRRREVAVAPLARRGEVTGEVRLDASCDCARGGIRGLGHREVRSGHVYNPIAGTVSLGAHSVRHGRGPPRCGCGPDPTGTKRRSRHS
jgi:hypothetical protein